MRQFKKIYIEITNICNLACSFCPKTRRAPAYMPYEMFAQILQEVRLAGRYLYFHVMGEPLLHPDIGAFLDTAADAAMQVNITTNGTLLPAVGAILLSKPAVRQVNVSLHSMRGNSHERDAYLSGILAFADAARSAGKPYVCLRLWNEETGNAPLSNAPIVRQIERHFKCRSLPEQLPEQQHNGTVVPGIFMSRAQSFAWPSMQCDDQGSSGFCYGLRDQIAVLVDGTVVPCCLDAEGTLALGNIMEQPLEGIINSTRALNLYNGFSQRKVAEPLCRRCGYRTRFNKSGQ